MQSSRMVLLNSALLFCVLTLVSSKSVAQIIVQDHPHDSSVQLSSASEVVYEKSAPELIQIAARDLGDDIGRVSGSPARVVSASKATTQIWIGILGQDPRIDSLVNNGSIDGSRLRDCWECFDISVLRNPLPGVNAVLVIAGSDRRGAAYGAYEVSRKIGVSPWYWWADVSPMHRRAIHVSVPNPVFSRPAVKYRGIFINDEDWGLFRWAKNTYDPETGNFGPKTYEKIFQLLLRLRANSLWPAMHQVSAPFNSNPRNAQLADMYGIIMSSSHAEPMLRNNVGEWKEDHNLYNFITNHDGVMQYWEQRVVSNGKYENILSPWHARDT